MARQEPMNKLIVGNLVHRPLRSVISAFAVGIEVLMILSIAGVMFGILNGSRTQTTGIGMDMIAHPGAASALLNTGAASADVRVAGVLRGLPNVQAVSPVNIKLSAGTSLENIYGIDYESYNALKPFVFVAGGPFQHPYDVLVDDLQAKSGKGLKVGDTLVVLGKPFTVCGIVEHGKGARKYIPIETMDDIDGSPHKASLFYIRTTDFPKHQEDVRREVLATQGLEDWSVQTVEEYLSTLTPERMPGFNIALRVVIGIAVIIGFMVIFQSMYTAVMERTREIGILKSMGAARLDIVSVVLRETGLLAVIGVVLGIAGTFVLRCVLRAKFPTMSFQVTPGWIATAVAIAMFGAMFGALYPALKAASKDPIDALSYE
jgi:putative ABC transport system permease protein